MENQEQLMQYVAVVGFHHQQGNRLEFIYPSPPVELHECATDWKWLPFYAIPDGAHNSTEDSVWFQIQSPDDSNVMLHAVACYRQIELENIYEPTEDMNRSQIQKSVVLISKAPIYGLMEARTSAVTKAFFDTGPEQFKSEFLKVWFDNFKLDVSLDTIREGMSVNFVLDTFKQSTLRILKLLLLQKKILIYGIPASDVCSTIVSILSLLPGSTESGWVNFPDDIVKAGLPFPLFGEENVYKPYLPVQHMDAIKNRPAYFVGVCNMLFTSTTFLEPDIIIYMETGNISVVNTESRIKSLMRLDEPDRLFMENILQKQNDYSDGTWEGSEDWIRKQFAEYFLRLCSLATFNNIKEKSPELKERIFSGSTVDYNYTWFEAWKETPGYANWSAQVDESIFDLVPPIHPFGQVVQEAEQFINMNSVTNVFGKAMGLFNNGLSYFNPGGEIPEPPLLLEDDVVNRDSPPTPRSME